MYVDCERWYKIYVPNNYLESRETQHEIKINHNV